MFGIPPCMLSKEGWMGNLVHQTQTSAMDWDVIKQLVTGGQGVETRSRFLARPAVESGGAKAKSHRRLPAHALFFAVTSEQTRVLVSLKSHRNLDSAVCLCAMLGADVASRPGH
eukprot:1082157-Rhodomonas_salina.3